MKLSIQLPWGKGLGTLGFSLHGANWYYHLDLFISPRFGWFSRWWGPDQHVPKRIAERKCWGAFWPLPRANRIEVAQWASYSTLLEGRYTRARGWRWETSTQGHV